ncbi:nuclear transport factor 2 family protein [Bosea caraganae]|uniref:Nuclear transport factor 2 family protein n=1 Tax=Bosea caraganae TaxID=2763117 RepID=A0A370L534_9HYPH|nr:nuclear transport factor 2 family protein [Bosea caraganae]RDJ24060.1 nuclear transport factor 2 family protein [Bosea caraganae]RDJ30102.1 nuclear transport factor 2 family protein [Bosea caraganae]
MTQTLPADLGPSAAQTDEAAEVRALFERQVRAENAHDLAGIDAVLAPDTPAYAGSVMFVARAGQFFGREAVLQRFENNFRGTWQFEPEIAECRITRLGPDTMHLYVPTRITIGAPGQAARTLRFLINQIAVRTTQGWRFTTIIPVPAE